MNIIQTPSPNYYKGRLGWKPDVIVWHISTDTLKSMDSWFRTPNSQASSHYGISEDGSVVHQYVDEMNGAWTNGRVNSPTAKFVLKRPNVNPNYYCLTIENAGKDLAKASEGQRKTLYELTLQIAKKWNIPIDRDHILGHWEIDAKNRYYCPSGDHSLMDKAVLTLQGMSQPDELVSVLVHKSKVQKVMDFLRTI